MPEEESLVRRAQEKDAEAWTELYQRYFDRIYRYALVRVGNTMEAEDLAEQVFLKALQSISSYSWRGVPFAAWLFRIAHNLVVDHHRKPSSRDLPLGDQPLPEAGPDPSRQAEDNATLEQVLRAMEHLTLAQRRVVELRFMADLSVEETARLVGKSPGAVKALQHSALVSLRRLYAPEG